MENNNKNSNVKDRKKVLTKRFVILFVVFAMAIIWIFAILSSNDVLKSGTPRIITLICFIAVTIIYWVAFYIILRRQDQRKDK